MFILNAIFDYIVLALPMVRASEDAGFSMFDPKSLMEYIQADAIVKGSSR